MEMFAVVKSEGGEGGGEKKRRGRVSFCVVRMNRCLDCDRELSRSKLVDIRMPKSLFQFFFLLLCQGNRGVFAR